MSGERCAAPLCDREAEPGWDTCRFCICPDCFNTADTLDDNVTCFDCGAVNPNRRPAPSSGQTTERSEK